MLWHHGSYNTIAIYTLPFFCFLSFAFPKRKKQNKTKTPFVLKSISTSINRLEQCVQGNRGRARLQELVFTPTSKLHNKRLQHFSFPFFFFFLRRGGGRKAPVNIPVTSKEVVPFPFTWLKLVLASSFVIERPWKLHWLHTQMINTAKTFPYLHLPMLLSGFFFFFF